MEKGGQGEGHGALQNLPESRGLTPAELSYGLQEIKFTRPNQNEFD